MVDQTFSALDAAERQNIDRRLTQLESSTQTLTGLANSLATTQALYEYKHDQANRMADKLESLVEKMIKKSDDHLSRVEAMLDDREHRLNDVLLAEAKLLRMEIQTNKDNLVVHADRLLKAEVKIDWMNKIVWVGTGIAMVVGFLADNLLKLAF